ncbi:hypothetical protein Tco_0526091 [Tanacetum coccineum]
MANNLPLRGGHSIVDPSCDVRIQKNLLDGVSQLALAVLVTGASQSRQHEVEIGDLLHEGFGGLEVLALSHTDFSDLFSVLIDAVNFPHMEKILPVGIHLRQVLDDMCFLISRNWEFPMGFFYFLDVIQEATTLRLRWNPISIRIAPKMWSSSLSSVFYSVLKNLGAITLTVCTTFDSRVESACFELTGLDKAIHLIKLGENWRDFERGGEQNNLIHLSHRWEPCQTELQMYDAMLAVYPLKCNSLLLSLFLLWKNLTMQAAAHDSNSS